MNHKQLQQLLKERKFIELYDEHHYHSGIPYFYTLMGHVEDGILFTFESHDYLTRTGNLPENAEVVDGKVYFNLAYPSVPREELLEKYNPQLQLSKADKVYMGSFDLVMTPVEEVLSTLDYFKSIGTFLPKWEQNPPLLITNAAKDKAVDGQCIRPPEGKTMSEYRLHLLQLYRQDCFKKFLSDFNPFKPIPDPKIGYYHLPHLDQ